MQIRLHVDNDNPLGSSALFLSHSVNVKTLGGIHFCVHSLHTHKHTYTQTHCTCIIFSDIPIGTKSSLSPGSKLGLSPVNLRSPVAPQGALAWPVVAPALAEVPMREQDWVTFLSPPNLTPPLSPYPSHSPIYPCSTLVYSVNTPGHLHRSFVTL